MTPFLQEGDNKSAVLSSHPSNAMTVIYRSKVVDNMMKTVNKAARSKAPLLLIGEKGVGKTFLARYIHEKSLVQLGPFQTLHCGTLSPKVLETELFGFKGDALTASREGALRLADGGTLFLNDLAKMPISIQEKLLDFLETGRMTPIGSNQSVEVKVRMIYAINNIEKIASGNLNKKLYEKMNAIQIPLLSERREDIPDLVRYFLNHKNQNGRKYVITEPALDALKCYKWSGNVKELKNICEHLQLFSDTGTITVKDLPKNILDADEFSLSMEYDPALTLSDINRIYILNALKHFSSKKKAAKALGITVKTLYNRLHEYGIFDHYAMHSKN